MKLLPRIPCGKLRNKLHAKKTGSCLFGCIVTLAFWNIFWIWIVGISITNPQKIQYFLAKSPESVVLIQVENNENNFESPERRADLMEQRFYEMYRNSTDDEEAMALRIDRLYDNKTIRPRICNDCFHVNFKFIINNNVCYEQEVYILYLVFSKNSNFEQRNALRETWLSDLPANQTYVFILGKSENSANRNRIKQENQKFKDIVLVDFLESYVNLTYKTIMAFKWISKHIHCSTAKHVMKVDDDVYVNKKDLANVLKRRIEKSNTFALGGFCIHSSPPFRDRKSKYYAPENSYPGRFYPPFCSGTAYLTNMKTIKNILLVSPTVPFFHLEDVYIAMCLSELGRVVTDIRGFNVWRVFPTSCLNKSPLVITSHGLLPMELKQLWNTSCPVVNWEVGNVIQSLKQSFNGHMIDSINKLRKKHLAKKLSLIKLKNTGKKKKKKNVS